MEIGMFRSVIGPGFGQPSRTAPLKLRWSSPPPPAPAIIHTVKVLRISVDFKQRVFRGRLIKHSLPTVRVKYPPEALLFVLAVDFKVKNIFPHSEQLKIASNYYCRFSRTFWGKNQYLIWTKLHNCGINVDTVLILYVVSHSTVCQESSWKLQLKN